MFSSFMSMIIFLSNLRTFFFKRVIWSYPYRVLVPHVSLQVSPNIYKSMGKVNQTIFILELSVIYIHWIRKIKLKKEITFTTCNFAICYKCYVLSNYHLVWLIDWLIVGFLTPVANSAYIFRKRTCSTIY